MIRISAILILLQASWISIQAATINAASAGNVDVTAAIGAAVTGDIVVVPSGAATWTASVVIPDGKNIVLMGGGIGNTVISSALSLTLQPINNSSRITGFTFVQTGGPTTTYMIRNSGLGFRIDHCRFECTTKRYGIYTQGEPPPKGVIDHCQFYNMRNLSEGKVTFDLTDSGTSWSSPLGMGTDEAVYYEDNTYEMNPTFINCMDANYGGRYVMRYNDLLNTAIEAHSSAVNFRGTRKWEIYNNTIRQTTVPGVFAPMFIRAGTGVMFSNTVTGTFNQNQAILDNRRSEPVDEVFGSVANGAYGGHVIDGNQALSDGSGTHTGANGAATLTDSGRSWAVNKFRVTKLDGTTHRWFYVYNLADGSKMNISANDATTVSGVLAGGTRNNWNTGDSYKISDGYPARDSIGVSTDDWQWTALNPNPTQAIDAAYFWGNTMNGALMNCAVKLDCDRHIKPNINLFVNAGSKPGYTPYVYPHPLVSGATAPPAAPSNLQVSVIGSTQLNLVWTDNSTNEISFKVERSLTSGTGFAWVATTIAGITNYADTVLAPSTTYYYRVRAENDGGSSAYTAEDSATTATTTQPVFSVPRGRRGGIIRGVL